LDAPGTAAGEIDQLTNAGKLEEALIVARRHHLANRLDEEVLTRLFSLLLQHGRSQEVLDIAADYSKSSKREIDQLAPNLQLMAGYAYLHQKDVDQAIAWFGLVLRGAAGTRVGNVAGREIQGLLSRIVEPALRQYSDKWNDDPTIRQFFVTEFERRRKGGTVLKGEDTDYFAPSTYGLSPSAAVPDAGSAEASIVVVSPADGRFLEYGEAIRRGVDIARTELDPEGLLKIKFVEEERISESEPVIHAAKAVIGPLQIQSVDLVRAQAGPKVPIYSFIKRDRTTRENVYAMNVSIVHEGEALVEFATQGLGATKPVLLVPAKTADESVIRLGKLTEVRKVEPEISSDQLNQLLAGKDALLALFPLETFLPLIQQAKTLQPDLKIVGGSSFYDPAMLRSYVRLFEGSYVLMPFFPESERPVVQRFVARFRQRFQRVPDLISAIAYDTAKIVLPNYPPAAAAPEGGGEESKGGSEKASALGQGAEDLQGVSGVVSFSKKGGPKRHFTVLQVRDGEVVERGADYNTAAQ